MVLSLRTELAILCAVVAAAAYYIVGLYTGVISLIGYESRSERLQGFVSSQGGLSLELGLFPVWLPAGGAIRADYEVDAAFGAATFSVAPPLMVRTPLQVATAYVEGNRKGSVVFVAPTAGWYSFWSDASPIGGPRCHGKDVRMVDIMVGRNDCPAYQAAEIAIERRLFLGLALGERWYWRCGLVGFRAFFATQAVAPINLGSLMRS